MDDADINFKRTLRKGPENKGYRDQVKKNILSVGGSRAQAARYHTR